MRALLLTLALLGTAAAQSTPIIAVTDENGVAVSSARVSLQSPPQPAVRCQTDFTGRCPFPALPAGQYQLRVEKEGFYALVEPNIQLTPGSTIEVSISHQQEVREIVDVHESPPAIDPASNRRAGNHQRPRRHQHRLSHQPRLPQRPQLHSRRCAGPSRPAARRRRPDLPDRHPARWLQRHPTRQRTTPGPRQH